MCAFRKRLCELQKFPIFDAIFESSSHMRNFTKRTCVHAWSIARAIREQAVAKEKIYTSVKIVGHAKNCRYKKALQGRVESMQQSSGTPSLHLGFLGLRKIVACSQPNLAVPSCIYSFWHGVIPTSYFIFTLVVHIEYCHVLHLKVPFD